MRGLKTGWAIAFFVAVMIALPAWTMAPKGSQAMHMDFSKVTSRAKAEALVKRGDLVKIRFVPERFGGPDDIENTGYVPPGALFGLNFVYDRISGLIKIKSVTSLVVDLDYRGKSIVPSRIVYIGTGKRKGDAPIEFAVNIW
ncbi:MAG: hypothetical protein ACK4ZW_15000 [Blastomonas sp.]